MDAEDRYFQLRDENTKLKIAVNKKDDTEKKLRTRIAFLEQALERKDGDAETERELVDARAMVVAQREEIDNLRKRIRSLETRLRSAREEASRRPSTGRPRKRHPLEGSGAGRGGRPGSASRASHRIGATREAWEARQQSRSRSRSPSPSLDASLRAAAAAGRGSGAATASSGDPALRHLAARLQQRLVQLERRLQETTAENQRLRSAQRDAGLVAAPPAPSSGARDDQQLMSGAEARMDRRAREAEARCEALRVRLGELESHMAARGELYDRTVQALERQAQELRETRAALQRAEAEAEGARDKGSRLAETERALSEARDEARRLEDQLQELLTTPFFHEGEDRAQLRHKAAAAEQEAGRLRDVVSHLQGSVRTQHAELDALRREARELSHALEDAKEEADEQKQRADTAWQGASVLREHLALYTGADGDEAGVPLRDLEEALTIVRRRRDRPQHVPFLDEREAGEGATIGGPVSQEEVTTLRHQLREAKSAELAASQRLERAERMLKTQRSYTTELEEEVRDLTERAGSATAGDQRRLLELERLVQRKEEIVRTLRGQIESLSQRLRSAAAGGRRGADGGGGGGGGGVEEEEEDALSTSGNTLTWDSGADLRAGENALEVFLSSLQFFPSAEVGDRDLTFVLLDFFDFESQASPVRAGRSPRFDFAAVFRFSPDDEFLRFAAQEHAVVEVMRVAGSGDAELVGRATLPLRELLVAESGKVVLSHVPIRGRSGQAIGAVQARVRVALPLAPHWSRFAARFPQEDSRRAMLARSDAEQRAEGSRLSRSGTGGDVLRREEMEETGLVTQPAWDASALGWNELRLRVIGVEGLSSRHGRSSPSPFVAFRFPRALGFAAGSTTVGPPSGGECLFEEHWTFPVMPTAHVLATLRDGTLALTVGDASDAAAGKEGAAALGTGEEWMIDLAGKVVAVVGSCRVALAALAEGLALERTFPLLSPEGRPAGRATIELAWRDPLQAVAGAAAGPNTLTRPQWSHYLARFQGPRRGGIRARSLLRSLCLSDSAWDALQRLRQRVGRIVAQGAGWESTLRATGEAAGRKCDALDGMDLATALAEAEMGASGGGSGVSRRFGAGGLRESVRVPPDLTSMCRVVCAGLKDGATAALPARVGEQPTMGDAEALFSPVELIEVIRPADPRALAAETRLRDLVARMRQRGEHPGDSLRDPEEDATLLSQRPWDVEWSRRAVEDWAARCLGVTWVEDPVDQAVRAQRSVKEGEGSGEPLPAGAIRIPRDRAPPTAEGREESGAVSPLSTSPGDEEEEEERNGWRGAAPPAASFLERVAAHSAPSSPLDIPPPAAALSSSPSSSSLPSPVTFGVLEGVWNARGGRPSLEDWEQAAREAAGGEGGSLDVPALRSVLQRFQAPRPGPAVLHGIREALGVGADLGSQLRVWMQREGADRAAPVEAPAWVAHVKALFAASERVSASGWGADPLADASRALQRHFERFGAREGVLSQSAFREALDALAQEHGMSRPSDGALRHLLRGLDSGGTDEVDTASLLRWWADSTEAERSPAPRDARARSLIRRRQHQMRRVRRWREGRGEGGALRVCVAWALPGEEGEDATGHAVADELLAGALDATEQAVRGWLAAAWLENPSVPLSARLGGERELSAESLRSCLLRRLGLAFSLAECALVVEALDSEGRNTVPASALDGWVQRGVDAAAVSSRDLRVRGWPLPSSSASFPRVQAGAWLRAARAWCHDVSPALWTRWARDADATPVLVTPLEFAWTLQYELHVAAPWSDVARWGREFLAEGGLVDVSAWWRALQLDAEDESLVRNVAARLGEADAARRERVFRPALRSAQVDWRELCAGLKREGVAVEAAELGSWRASLARDDSGAVMREALEGWLRERNLLSWEQQPSAAAAAAAPMTTTTTTVAPAEAEPPAPAAPAPPPAPAAPPAAAPTPPAAEEAAAPPEADRREAAALVRSLARAYRRHRRLRARGWLHRQAAYGGRNAAQTPALPDLLGRTAAPDPRIVLEALDPSGTGFLPVEDVAMAVERVCGTRPSQPIMRALGHLLKIEPRGEDGQLPWGAILVSLASTETDTEHLLASSSSSPAASPAHSIVWLRRAEDIRRALRRRSREEGLSANALFRKLAGDRHSITPEALLEHADEAEATLAGLSEATDTLSAMGPNSRGNDLTADAFATFLHDGDASTWRARLRARCLAATIRAVRKEKAGGSEPPAVLHVRAMFEYLDRRGTVKEAGEGRARDASVPLKRVVTRRRLQRALRLLAIDLPDPEWEMLCETLWEGGPSAPLPSEASSPLQYEPLVALLEESLVTARENEHLLEPVGAQMRAVGGEGEEGVRAALKRVLEGQLAARSDGLIPRAALGEVLRGMGADPSAAGLDVDSLAVLLSGVDSSAMAEDSLSLVLPAFVAPVGGEAEAAAGAGGGGGGGEEAVASARSGSSDASSGLYRVTHPDSTAETPRQPQPKTGPFSPASPPRQGSLGGEEDENPFGGPTPRHRADTLGSHEPTPRPDWYEGPTRLPDRPQECVSITIADVQDLAPAITSAASRVQVRFAFPTFSFVHRFSGAVRPARRTAEVSGRMTFPARRDTPTGRVLRNALRMGPLSDPEAALVKFSLCEEGSGKELAEGMVDLSTIPDEGRDLRNHAVALRAVDSQHMSPRAADVLGKLYVNVEAVDALRGLLS